jgi:hypothetical protein
MTTKFQQNQFQILRDVTCSRKYFMRFHFAQFVWRLILRKEVSLNVTAETRLVVERTLVQITVLILTAITVLDFLNYSGKMAHFTIH